MVLSDFTSSKRHISPVEVSGGLAQDLSAAWNGGQRMEQVLSARARENVSVSRRLRLDKNKKHTHSSIFFETCFDRLAAFGDDTVGRSNPLHAVLNVAKSCSLVSLANAKTVTLLALTRL